MEAQSNGNAVPSGCPDLPDDVWLMVIDDLKDMHGLRAAKELRKIARVMKLFAHEARSHPDNIEG